MTAIDAALRKHIRLAWRYDQWGHKTQSLLHRHQALVWVIRDLEYDPNNGDLHRILGDLRFAAGHWSAACQAYEAAQHHRNRHPLRMYHNWAEALLNNRQPRRGLAILRRIAHRTPPHHRTYTLLGEGWFRRRQWDKAHEAYETAIALNATLPATVYQRWYRTLNKVHPPETHHLHLQEKLARHEGSPELHYWLAQTHHRQQQWQEAILHYETAASLKPEIVTGGGYSQLCQALRECQRPQEAAQWARRGLLIHPQEANLHFLVAQQHLRDHQWTLARHHYQLAMRHNANFLARAHRPLGNVLHKEGHLPKPLALWGEPYSFQAKNFHPQPSLSSAS